MPDALRYVTSLVPSAENISNFKTGELQIRRK